MKIFNKLKDYNEILEAVLDNKYFASSTKNIWLSMLYKLEIAYPDYMQVKRVVRDKNDFLTEVIDTIKEYCENIQVVEPDSDDAKLLKKHNVLALTNDRERSILTYPTELAFLYAVSDIVPKYFIIDRNFVFKDLMQTMLVEGYNYNNVSILQDFNGWSWDNSSKKGTPFISNLIYQNLLFLFGEEFLTAWRNSTSLKDDYVEMLRKHISTLDATNNYFKEMLTLIYKASSEAERKRIEPRLQEYVKEYKSMQNMDKYLQDIKAQKIAVTKRIAHIDKVQSNTDLLIEEFKKTNKPLDDDKKIGNIKVFNNMLKNERKELQEKLQELTDLQNPVMYLKHKEEIGLIVGVYTNKSTLEDTVIRSQLEYLKLYDKKLTENNTVEEILDIIYELRFYKKINLNSKRKIDSIERLNKQVDIIFRKAITKACKLGIIKIVSMDIMQNYEIIKFALDTNIIELSDIKLELEKISNDKFVVRIYDKDVFEKDRVFLSQVSKKELKKDIQIKFNKPTKLFYSVAK